MINNKTKNLTLASLMLAIGIVLPLFTSQIKEIGDSLLPMHLPVMLCGIICGWKYGGVIGFCMPFLRSILFGMPPIYPNAVWMALELATYGLLIGLTYNKKKNKSLIWLYVSLVTSMIGGRIVWGVAKLILLCVKGEAFTLTAFISGGFIDAIPGIILQLILIPLVISIIKRYSNVKN